MRVISSITQNNPGYKKKLTTSTINLYEKLQHAEIDLLLRFLYDIDEEFW